MTDSVTSRPPRDRANPGGFKAILFDWDGTVLANSLHLKIQNAGRLFSRSYQVTADSVEASYRRHSGIPRRSLFDRISADCMGRALAEEEFEGLSRAFTAANLESVATKSRLRPEARASLEALLHRRCLLFVSTSASQDEVARLARHFDVDRLFTAILGSAPEFTKGPEHAAHVIATYDLDPRDLAAVGDESNDIRLQLEAGITAVGITGTEDRGALLAAGAHFVIDDLTELVPYVA